MSSANWHESSSVDAEWISHSHSHVAFDSILDSMPCFLLCCICSRICPYDFVHPFNHLAGAIGSTLEHDELCLNSAKYLERQFQIRSNSDIAWSAFFNLPFGVPQSEGGCVVAGYVTIDDGAAVGNASISYRINSDMDRLSGRELSFGSNAHFARTDEQTCFIPLDAVWLKHFDSLLLLAIVQSHKSSLVCCYPNNKNKQQQRRQRHQQQ